jgi:hypothetical protein
VMEFALLPVIDEFVRAELRAERVEKRAEGHRVG